VIATGRDPALARVLAAPPDADKSA